jgi:hypothetical protein
VIGIRWNSNLAYAIGLIATDGCLSKDGRHIDFTSKDLEQINNFLKAINSSKTIKIGTKYSSYNPTGIYYHVQFSNVRLYRFLIDIGLTPNKSKTLGILKIPNKYFIDFLRGSLDGDGCTYSYSDPRWKSSFQLYTRFISASREHLEWLNSQIILLYGIKGTINLNGRAYSLEFAKYNSLILLKRIYYKKKLIYLKRKYSKIIKALSIIDKRAGVL